MRRDPGPASLFRDGPVKSGLRSHETGVAFPWSYPGGEPMATQRDHDPADSRNRKPLRLPQPHSTAGLRPSQRRAAERRATFDRERAAEHWLRRLARR